MINDFGPHAKPILVSRMINQHLFKHNNRIRNVQAHSEFKELIDRSFQVRAKKNPKKELQEKMRLKEIQRDNDHLFKKLTNIYNGKYKESIHQQQKANQYFLNRHCDYPRNLNHSEFINSPRRYSPDSYEEVHSKRVYLPVLDNRSNSKDRENTNILAELNLATGPTPKSDLRGEDKVLYKRDYHRNYASPKRRDISLNDGTLTRSPNDSLAHITYQTKHTVSYLQDSDDDMIPPIGRQKTGPSTNPAVYQKKVKFKSSVYHFKVLDYKDILIISMRDSDYGKEYQLSLTPQQTYQVRAKYGTEYDKIVKHLRIEREKLILVDHYSISIRNSANLAELRNELKETPKLNSNNTVDGIISPIQENILTESPVSKFEVPGYTVETKKYGKNQMKI